MAPLNGKAILFDFDGVLIDSPEYHVRAWVEMFRPYGLELTPERLHRKEGRRSLEIAREIIAENHLDIDDATLDRLIEEKRSFYRKIADLRLRKDAALAVRCARGRGWKIGLVSGSYRDNVSAALTGDEFELFDVLITAEDYTRGKPDPEPYLIASRRLKLAPQDCIVVENAPLGIIAAKRAGAKVIALTSTLPASELVGADLIIGNLCELESLLLQI